MTSEMIAKTYARLLKWHGMGHALWDPADSTQIPLGSIGFFDSKGRWNLLFDSFRDVPDAPKPFTEGFKVLPLDSGLSGDFTSNNFEASHLSFGGAFEYVQGSNRLTAVARYFLFLLELKLPSLRLNIEKKLLSFTVRGSEDSVLSLTRMR